MRKALYASGSCQAKLALGGRGVVALLIDARSDVPGRVFITLKLASLTGPSCSMSLAQTVTRRIVANPPANNAAVSAASTPVKPDALRSVKNWPMLDQASAQMAINAAASSTMI